MSDVPDGSGQIQRRVPRSTETGSPVSGALAIGLAVIAVVAGFLILRSISGDDEQQLGIPGSGASPSGTDSAPQGSDSAPQSTAPLLPAPTTEPPLVTTGASVIVANASGIGGSAGSMTTALEIAGYTMGGATNQAGGLAALEVSQIYYDAAQPAAEPVAQSLARTLGGGIAVTPLAGTPPVQSGSLDGAGVLLMLGTDKAGKSLADLNPVTTTPVVVTNPQLTGTTVPPG